MIVSGIHVEVRAIMNVSNFANLFSQNNIFQQNRLLGQTSAPTPISNTLNRLSESLTTAQEQAKNMKARFDTLELSAEAADGAEHSSLADVPEGLLRYYLHMCRFGASISQSQETSLAEYRDQLSTFDQTIQTYQDMLSGKTALPSQMKQEDVALLLEHTRAAREQFLQQGAQELNRISREGPTPEKFLGRAYSMITGYAKNAQDHPRWEIDPESDDIYGEIDRALATAHRTTSTFRDGASGVLAELKRRGCVQAEEDFSLDGQASAERGPSMMASLAQDLYDGIWTALRQSAAEKSDPWITKSGLEEYGDF